MTRLATLSGLIVLPLVGCLAWVWLTQRRLIYFPLAGTPSAASNAHPHATDVSFDTEDGFRLRGWLVPAVGPVSRKAVIVFNGNAGSREHRLPIARGLSALGYSVLLFDYRGYGGNPGRPSERGLLADARAARSYLASRPDVDPTRLVYFGESLGAAVALALAVEAPPAALILRSPFTSLQALGKLHYPYLPVGLLLRDRYPSLERVTRLRTPLLVVAGERDQVVPHEHSRLLYEAAPIAQKQFVSLAGADHNDPRLTNGDELMSAVATFLASATRGEVS